MALIIAGKTQDFDFFFLIYINIPLYMCEYTHLPRYLHYIETCIIYIYTHAYVCI